MQTVTLPVLNIRAGAEDFAKVSPARCVSIVAKDAYLAGVIADRLQQSAQFESVNTMACPAFLSLNEPIVGTVVYVPSMRRGMSPDLLEAEKLFDTCARTTIDKFVLISSAAIYNATFRNPGLLSESSPLPKNRASMSAAACWSNLENHAKRVFREGKKLIVLRCSTLLCKQSANQIARCFTQQIVPVIPGHDPCIQLLSPGDLAQAIQCVLRSDISEVFNVSPDGVMPLKKALKRSPVRRIPVPRTLQRTWGAICGKPRRDDLEFLRYPWTVSNEKIKGRGFQPCLSTAEALAEFCGQSSDTPTWVESKPEHFDDFGMDKDYIAFYGRTLFRFLADWYWRIECAGIENIPQSGRAVLAGIHRGFMPWDGVMALDLIVKRTGRHPRFLIHPGLVKFPFLANFMTKLGGIIACQENARRVLESDELLGVFPEGIRGAFVHYSNAYQIRDFHRDAFVKIALRHRAPIIPFVTVGSAEIFPILGELNSRWWSKYSEWPALPITPTFPLIPLPLPSKWHTRFLPAMHLENDYPPSAATDISVVRALSREVRQRMQRAVDEMLEQRTSIFFGSIFQAGVR